MNEARTNGPLPKETAFRGKEITVEGAGGEPEAVRIHQLSLRHADDLLGAQSNEVALALLYTGRDREWFDALPPDSQMAIVEEGDRINANFLKRFLERRLTQGERINPGSRAKALAAFNPSTTPEPEADGTLPNSLPLRVVPAG